MEALLPLFSAPGSNGARMGHDVLMSRICLLAARKSFASKKSEPAGLLGGWLETEYGTCMPVQGCTPHGEGRYSMMDVVAAISPS